MGPNFIFKATHMTQGMVSTPPKLNYFPGRKMSTIIIFEKLTVKG